ncbi:acyl-CoA/acyl-ACP dehydrogenase [Nocardioides panacisoli]|uniref:acyl-CoA dehydrogenase family protein n=1 Tax=Nocardioides panacisoli TaxID=627624 RepID=UPI001C62D7E7|nr:acyl-CoA dehydrogenase family protein [Nocardioides panacisoli]QYJ03619.1 acyl-CoA/acyl-ACP dehydrogenase [Nocardioides panacisoli]
MTETLDIDRGELEQVTGDLLARHCDVAHLRDRLEAGGAHAPALWWRLAETGLVSALVPAEFGGAGLEPAHLPGVLHATGYHALPEPLLETAVLAVTLLAAFPDHPDADARLGGIAEGSLLATVRFGDADRHVAFAADAHLVLDVAPDGAVTAYAADQLEVVPAAGVDPLRPVAAVIPHGAGDLLGTSPDVAAHVRDLAVAGAACQLAGAARRLLDLTVEYVADRHQFGRPVGSFQAVKHKIADVAVGVDMAEAAALGAFGAEDAHDRARRAASAKAYAGQAADRANVEALQLHGGIGFTWEHHLHVWLKRTMSLTAAHGTPAAHRRTLARDLLARIGEEE